MLAEETAGFGLSEKHFAEFRTSVGGSSHINIEGGTKENLFGRTLWISFFTPFSFMFYSLQYPMLMTTAIAITCFCKLKGLFSNGALLSSHRKDNVGNLANTNHAISMFASVWRWVKKKP